MALRNGSVRYREDVVPGLEAALEAFRDLLAGRRRCPPQHLHYHQEVLVGHEVSSHLRLVGRTDRLLHGMAFLVNRTKDTLANTFEFALGNVDLEEYHHLDWEVPVFSTTGLRRGSISSQLWNPTTQSATPAGRRSSSPRTSESRPSSKLSRSMCCACSASRWA